MKLSIKIYIFLVFAVVSTACEDVFFPPLEEAPPQVVVDGWLNDLPGEQVIKLTWTQPYYEASFPPGVANATVFVVDSEGKRFDFVENGSEGEYVWSPTAADPVLTKVGNAYELTIQIDDITLTAVSACGRVPAIDSLNFRFEPENFFPEGYYANFFARDPAGLGDTYWIKAYKNGSYLNKPNEINIAFDAGFSQGSEIDGIYFIQPIRDAINPIDEDENDNFLPPYEPGDSVGVEIHSITSDAFTFLNEVRIQTDRPGGFGELFSTPLSNVPTNIEVTEGESELPALGFFNVSAVSTGGLRLDPDNLPPRN